MKRSMSTGFIIELTVKRGSILLLSGALLWTLGACTDALAPAAEEVAQLSLRHPAAPRAAGESVAARSLRTFAMNALLLPLLDAEPDAPARWADPSFSVDCVDAWVTVDGSRPDVGAPVPDRLTVRWQMDRCTPLGPHLEVSGSVVMHVEAGMGGYTAQVVPAGLSVSSADGVDALTEPFAASLPTNPDARPVGTASLSRSTSGS